MGIVKRACQRISATDSVPDSLAISEASLWDREFDPGRPDDGAMRTGRYGSGIHSAQTFVGGSRRPSGEAGMATVKRRSGKE